MCPVSTLAMVAKRKRHSEQHQRRGPLSLEEVFDWAQVAVSEVLRRADQDGVADAFRSELAALTQHVVVSTSYSGMGCAEMALPMLQSALGKHGIASEFHVHSACDSTALCQSLLVQHEDQGHVFADILDLIPTTLRTQLLELAARGRALLEKRCVEKSASSTGGPRSGAAADASGDVGEYRRQQVRRLGRKYCMAVCKELRKCNFRGVAIDGAWCVKHQRQCCRLVCSWHHREAAAPSQEGSVGPAAPSGSSTAGAAAAPPLAAKGLAALSEFPHPSGSSTAAAAAAPPLAAKGLVAPSEFPHGVRVEIAGSTCVAWSAMGAGLGWLHDSGLPCLVWLHWVAHTLPHVFIHECTAHFDEELLHEVLGGASGAYLVTSFQHSPVDLGIPSQRIRKYTWGVRRDVVDSSGGGAPCLSKMTMVGTATRTPPVLPGRAEFLSLFGRTLELDASVYLAAPAPVIQDVASKLARERYLQVPALGATIPWKPLLSLAHRVRLAKYKEMLQEHKELLTPSGDVATSAIVNLHQTPGVFGITARTAPALLKASRLYSLQLDRPLLAVEHFLVQGIPLRECLPAGMACAVSPWAQPAQAFLSDGEIRRLTGNGMHLSQVGTTLLHSLTFLAMERAVGRQSASWSLTEARTSATRDRASEGCDLRDGRGGGGAPRAPVGQSVEALPGAERDRASDGRGA